MKTRDTSNGQYKKSSKLFPTLIILTIIILSVLAIRQKLISPVAEVATPVIVDHTDHELQAIMDEATFKKAMELKAQKIKIERKKTTEMNRHEALMKDIEVELEAVRRQELDKTSL